jgi:pimeloyl-ACP methyl ester carboxylesterase
MTPKSKKPYESNLEEERQKYIHFKDTHPINHIDFNGRKISYILTGKGKKTILTFSGGHSTPHSAYETIFAFKEDYQILVVDISSFPSREELNEGIQYILRHQNIGRVILLGQSMSGIIAQLYFLNNYQSVDALVLTNTPAPNREKNKKWALPLIYFLPHFILKPLLKKELNKLAQVNIELTPTEQARVDFKMELLNDIMDNQFSKKTMINIIKLSFGLNKSEYTVSDFPGWTGKSLVITCEDDPYHKDAGRLSDMLPNSQVFTFPAGWKHIAPIVHINKFHVVIRDFLKGT